MREVVLPFVRKRLLETNYENLGESDAEEFAKEFNEILNLAIKALEQEPQSFKWCTDCKEYDQEKHCCHRYSKVVKDTVAEIRQELKTGHWVGIDEYPHEDYECDNCGFIHTFIDGHTAQYNYCPNCGAKMVEPQESEG
jgi:uncharacterized paraquat-inducible protein A